MHAPDVVLGTQFQVNDAKEQLWWNSTLHTSAKEPGSPGCAPDHSPLPNIPASDTLNILLFIFSVQLALRIHTTAPNSHYKHVYKCYYK